jgi:U2-associated protein SR140
LFDVHHQHFIYYKWRTFSYAQGETERAWRIEPFQMCIGGPVWVPPPLPYFDKEKEKEKMKKINEESDKDSLKDNEDLEYFQVAGKFNHLAKDEGDNIRLPYQLKREYISILDELTVKQTDICNAMIFVMENTEYCKPIIQTLKVKIME